MPHSNPLYEPLAATAFSFLRGASQPDEMVWAAHGLGLKGLGVADINNVAGVVRAHVAAKEAGIRLIVGSRLVTPFLPRGTGEESHSAGFHTIIYPKEGRVGATDGHADQGQSPL
jgi:error-prone DNA polymerase